MSEKLAVGSWQLPVPGQAAGNWQPATGNCRSGFTLIEIMVAIGVATILFGICTTIFVKVSKYKSRSEKLLFTTQEANGALSRMARDLQGLYAGDATTADYWNLESGVMGSCGDRLTILAATENPGKADHCRVSYYVKKPAADQPGKLYRVLSGGVPPGGGWSLTESAWVIAEDVDKLTITSVPSPPAAGQVPKHVTVTLRMSDPEGQPGYRIFSITVRPGSEEN